LDDTMDDVKTTITHLIKTTVSLVIAALHPVNTYGIMKEAIRTSYYRDVTNGDAESCARWFSYAVGTIITSVVGTKGAGTMTKAGATSAKATAKQVKDSLNHISVKNNNSFNLKPAYVTEGNHVPYNMYNGDAVKHNTLQL